MSRRVGLRTQLRTLTEIGEIMSSMKTLAQIETRKLGQAQALQAQVAEAVARVAEDFRSFHPEAVPVAGLVPVTLVIGSERGFVGDYNQSLIAAAPDAAGVIAVGARLAQRWGEDPRVLARLAGPSSTEELDAVIGEVVRVVGELARTRGPLEISVLNHAPEQPEPARETLFPPYRDAAPAARHGTPPRLNLGPQEFLLALLDHYLLSVLQSRFSSALMAENQRRILHLDGALRRLDERRESLSRRSQQLRQEEITEEIELIVQNAELAAE